RGKKTAFVFRRQGRQELLVEHSSQTRPDRMSSLRPHGSVPSRLVRSTGTALVENGLAASHSRADSTVHAGLGPRLAESNPADAGELVRGNSRTAPGRAQPDMQFGSRTGRIGTTRFWSVVTAGAGSSVNR